MDYHGNPPLFRLAAHGLQLDFSKTTDRYFGALCNSFVRLFAGESVDGRLPGGDKLGGLTPADPESGGNHAVQPEGSQRIPELLYLRLLNGRLIQRNLSQMEAGSSR